MKAVYIFCSFFFISQFINAQEPQSSISGKVTSASGRPLAAAYIYLKNTSVYALSDENGDFTIDLEPGDYELGISHLGYAEFTKRFGIKAGEEKRFSIQLESDESTLLDNVYLRVRSEMRSVQESSYNVAVINTEELHNTAMDLSEALDRASGVRVRRSGGMGSDFNLMLNGFTGRHVKYFIDGVPMEGMNSAFQLNNIPVNMAKRIEVYKGVVPLNFGTDALGGAVNIVTAAKGKQNFLDASYSFGSFNTHKSFLNTAYTSDSGFTAQFTAYHNYSDNNYKVDADIVDLENHQFKGDIRRVRRFHDQYKNLSVQAKIGFINTSFADRLLLDLSYGDEYDEIQHPAYMKIAFGQKYTKAKLWMPQLTYQKKNLFIENLNFSVVANYNFGRSQNIDDSYRKYNWLGEFIEKDAPGEFNYTKQHLKNHNASVNTNLTYTIADMHAFTLNNVLNSFWRKTQDKAEPKPSDDHPSETLKDIVGFGYRFQPDDRLSLSAFSKYYYNKVAQFADPTSSGTYQQLSTSTDDLGYGLAGSYFLWDDFQVKASYEKAFRMPTGRELFGAGNDFELGNPDLKSESSDNFNAGLQYTFPLGEQHVISLDGSFIYRDIKDFIRQVPDPSDGVLKPGNEALVKNRGIDFGINYQYDRMFSWEASFSYQDLRNKLKYRTGKEVVSTIYNDRIPNTPYLFGNTNFNFYFNDLFEKADHLHFSYSLQYIHEFDYSYESYGGRKIPTQVVHDIGLNYSMKNGRYNVSFIAGNIFDEQRFDNFSLEKPGRNFSIKLRYFLDSFN